VFLTARFIYIDTESIIFVFQQNHSFNCLSFYPTIVKPPLLFMIRISILLFLSLGFFQLSAQQTTQDEDAFFIRSIYDHSLIEGKAYSWLNHLCNQIGPRLSASPKAAAAIEYTRQQLNALGLDTVWLQPCVVPHWERGTPEIVRIVNAPSIGSVNLHALALGNSGATPPQGLTAEVIEVRSLDELEALGREKVEGKIVFFNRPLDVTQLRTFNAYGGAVDQRGYGPSRSAQLGALACLVRSMTTSIDQVPHTGTTLFTEGQDPIPALGISTVDANLLSQTLKQHAVSVYIHTSCKKYSDKPSFNVIGEIRGSMFPDEIILVGGHLDSWDVGQGAHDDGAGCVQAMDVLATLQAMNYRPKRTLRCVLFMNEENGLAGGTTYASKSNAKKEFHLAAIESDAGGFTPRGFSCAGHKDSFTEQFKSVIDWLPLLEPYGLWLEKGGAGADITPLKSQKGLLIGFRPDSQRYFDYHHTREDTFDKVNKRELELGAASMTALVYLIDKYGL
jgi:carboxypeptidase Q